MKRKDSKLYLRWSQEMRRLGWFHAGERIGIAVSGGPDSMLLLSFMRQLGAQSGFLPVVLHFNHHLRGEEANQDEEFVAQQAAKAGLEFIRGEAAVGRIARERRRNLEATARELRYEFFLNLVRQGKLDKTATAHTADDQAETLLLRLFRGAGARGLGGIQPVLAGQVYRPFLDITRSEVEEEAGRRGLEFRVDRTNLDRRFARNRIRLELLPLLRAQYNPAIVSVLKGFADRARDDEAYLDAEAQERGRAWRIRGRGEEKIPVRCIADFPPALARRVLRQMIASVGGGLRGVSSQHLEELRRLALSQRSGSRLSLAGELQAVREFDCLVIRKRKVLPEAPGYAFQLSLPAEIAIPQAGLKFRFRTAENIELGREETQYNNAGSVLIDFEKVSGPLVLRNWLDGDRFQLPGRRSSTKLKRIFLQHRVPAEQRRSWPVLVSGEEAVWIRGFPPAGRVAATPESRRVLVIEEQALDSSPGGEES